MVVVGGLIFSQLVTLYLTPVVYTYMAQAQNWFQSRRGASVPAVVAPASVGDTL
jgi:HAE1 family hydrophobic/amphiphilic exporter-1